MRAQLSDTVLRLAAAVGLAVSALLLVEYTRPIAGLCGDGGGCDLVKASAYARPLGVPLPLVGVAYFAALTLVATVPRLRRALRPLALAGAAGALAFVALQALAIGAFCKYCLVADGAALVAGGASLARGAAASRWRLSAALGVAALAVPVVAVVRAPAAPPASAVVAAPALPEVIAREQRPGVLTIVSFTDFECPFCRRLHVALEQALAGREDRVRVVRKMVPLAGLHPHALDAALAWCCADRVGQGDAMAAQLYATRDLSRAGCERLARDLGLDTAAFAACLADPATRAHVDRHAEEADAAGVAGRLPTYWIGGTMYRGAADAATLRARIDAALAGQPG